MSPHLQGHLAMLTFSALVAGSFSLGATAANEIAPAALNAARFWIAAVIIGTAAFAMGKVNRRAFQAPWRYLILGGLFAGYFVLMFYGLKTAAPVSAAAVFTLTPVMSGVFGWLLLRQVTTPRMAAALAIGGAGALWVIFDANWDAAFAFRVGEGEIIYFFGCILHALYTPMVPKLNRGEPPVVFTFGMLLAGGAILLVFGWSDIRATDWANLPPIVWICLFYLAIFASAATFVLLQFASLRLPSAKVMAYTYLTPSWVILWEVARGNGAPQGLVLVGIAMIVLALVMLLKQEG
ncbi:DMT family transporter [Falsiphaeobacter marinintestinus]|uniref:DMT family transporter n=1 Tax=Falsiphaeobacter marinintestinus TaxID=1492905 RepID=UPI0011B5C3C3|nr:DMT family transporter [Phaeobacter marinintestinus]